MSTKFQIKAMDVDAAGHDAEISIYDEIGEWGLSARAFNDSMKASGSKKPLVRINSKGGDVFDGIAIHNILRGYDATVRIEGIAASMASYIATAGRRVEMADNSWIMIHNPWGFAMGDAADMREQADLLERLTGTLANGYAAKSKQALDVVKGWMSDETWFDAAEAKALGLVDSITEQVSFSAFLTHFCKVPAVLRASMDQPQPAASKSMSNKLFSILGMKGSEREQFLNSAFTALGITESAIETAQKEGKPDFLAEHLNARITDLTAKITAAETKATEAEARATTQEGAAKALLAALGVKEAGADPAATVATAIKAKASAEAAEILASKGITKALDTAKASTGTASKTKDEIVAEFNGMKPGPERSAFFAKHKAFLV